MSQVPNIVRDPAGRGRLRSVARLAVIFVGMALVSVLATPWVLYYVALGAVDGRPQPPEHVEPAAAQAMWQKLGGIGPPRLERLSPSNYAMRFLRATARPTPPEEMASWLVARQYNLTHLERRGMGWWHFSGAALTIWVSLNWSAEQALATAWAYEPKGST